MGDANGMNDQDFTVEDYTVITPDFNERFCWAFGCGKAREDTIYTFGADGDASYNTESIYVATGQTGYSPTICKDYIYDPSVKSGKYITSVALGAIFFGLFF